MRTYVILSVAPVCALRLEVADISRRVAYTGVSGKITLFVEWAQAVIISRSFFARLSRLVSAEQTTRPDVRDNKKERCVWQWLKVMNE